MPEFILSRTSAPPAKIVGTRIIELASDNAHTPGAETSNRQWYVVTLYRTQAGTNVAHVQYRAGNRLREEPIDAVYTGKTGPELMAKLDAIDPENEFVTGWPHSSDIEYRRRHETVVDYADNHSPRLER